MKLGNARHLLVALLLLISLGDVDAVRGKTIRRRDNSLRQNRRRAEKNGDIPAASLEQDDPEAMAAAAATASAANGEAKAKRKKNLDTPSEASEDMFDQGIEMQEPLEETTQGDEILDPERQDGAEELPVVPDSKGTAKNSGEAEGEPDVPTFDSEDIYTVADPLMQPEESPAPAGPSPEIPAEPPGLAPGSSPGSSPGGSTIETTPASDLDVPDLERSKSDERVSSCIYVEANDILLFLYYPYP
jgi:hypothetical protein